MFLNSRLLSGGGGSAALMLAGATFAVGLGLGGSIGPLKAGRSHETPASASVTPVSVTPAAKVAPRPDGLVRTVHPAEALRVLDGDTFEARVHLWPGLDITTRVRLRGIDAPELRARCPEERSKAEAARDALQVLLDQGEVGISRVTLDKYGGRVVADASTSATPDVSAALLTAGLVRPYDGGRRRSWCAPTEN